MNCCNDASKRLKASIKHKRCPTCGRTLSVIGRKIKTTDSKNLNKIIKAGEKHG